MQIDFTDLPLAGKPNLPFRNMKLAAGIVFAILVVLALGALLTSNNNRENVIAVLGALGIAVFVVVCFGGFLHMFRVLRNQRAAMQLFAEKNNWYFDAIKVVAVGDKISPGVDLFSGNTMQRFRISGKHQGKNFEYYNFITSGPRAGGYWTLLRVAVAQQNINLQGNEEIYMYHAAGFNYFVRPGNVISREEVRRLFAAAGLN